MQNKANLANNGHNMSNINDLWRFWWPEAIPKRGTGFQPVEHMAKMAMPLEKKGYLKKQSQLPAGGGKSEARNSKS
jgi:hypothetical protein